MADAIMPSVMASTGVRMTKALPNNSTSVTISICCCSITDCFLRPLHPNHRECWISARAREFGQLILLTRGPPLRSSVLIFHLYSPTVFLPTSSSRSTTLLMSGRSPKNLSTSYMSAVSLVVFVTGLLSTAKCLPTSNPADISNRWNALSTATPMMVQALQNLRLCAGVSSLTRLASERAKLLT
ncbi:uncharacterized protein A1O9_04848 [Exophiala aquamarina CBS 119918]|uniref:Uncharacterized protein n=1 Tax=Exophiala aquamarina CBS 119918 TaxID=1182545 RepID=A0A072PIP9_9EURO|nr:uncharacterized protein A1O9_04848 [Exophiala aquamarina CBS 119918]KEF59999.1 hypothetical protein A1O9_04848 [Exophiala aquamarina CBS 119918]